MPTEPVDLMAEKRPSNNALWIILALIAALVVIALLYSYNTRVPGVLVNDTAMINRMMEPANSNAPLGASVPAEVPTLVSPPPPPANP
ncbi:MAG: hypothetical protein HY053_01005 [Proteobacteria bacterium]|nr:hypothetical protein [Pseudomonadota bacterium]